MTALAVVAALVGCGDSDPSKSTKVDASSGPDVRKVDFEGRQAQAYAGARDICEMEPRSETAVAEGLPAHSSVVDIARRYAAEWPQKLRRAVFEGCKAGLANVPVRFPASAEGARGIWGRNFIVISVVGEGEELPVTRPIHIRFFFRSEREHSVGWQARCNSFGGDVQITATTMEVSEVGSTLMGCEPAIQEEDEWLSDFMQADPEWQLHGERLQLRADDATIRAERR